MDGGTSPFCTRKVLPVFMAESLFDLQERKGGLMAPLKKNRVSKIATDAVTKKAWNKLVSERYVETSLLRMEIALSWKRCLQSNVDP